MDKTKRWANGLGWTLYERDGEWDFWFPNADAGLPDFRATYFPKGECFATLTGTGRTWEAARQSARPIGYK